MTNEQRAAYDKQYYQKHKIKIITQKKRYYQDHKNEIALRHRRYYQSHRTKIAEQTKRYRQKHRAEGAVYSRWYKQNHKGERSIYEQNYRANNIDFKLKAGIRRSIIDAIGGRKQYVHSLNLLGCSIKEVRTYIEQQFQPGMTWDNWSMDGWHIDHIIPLSYFDFRDYEQQKQAWHYTNLRPLWAGDNLRKGNKIVEIQLKLQ